MSIDVVVPPMGESVTTARVARWIKHEGEPVASGDPLVELETDKVNIDVPAPRAGTLTAILHGEGQDVGLGDVLGRIEEGAAAGEAQPASPERAASPAEAPPPAPPAPPSPPSPTPPAPRPSSVSRSARDARAEAPREPKRVVPPHAPPPVPASGERPEERVRMSRRRATIARRLVEAQRAAAMLTTFNEIDMSAVMALRERRKQAFRDAHGVGLGLVSFFVKAAVAALRECPRLNAEVQEEEMVIKHYYDIGVAVGAAEGLVVPVIHDADQLSFPEIERSIHDLSRRASDGSLTLDDLRGGTFTITNGGVFGSLLSTPILNPPQAGILGLHAVKDRPVVVNGAVVAHPMMFVALTYDHRIVDGAEAVRFLGHVSRLVEDPGNLLLES